MPKGEHKHTYIYGLIDPEELILRYVGQTVNPMARLSQHLGDNNWIGSDKHDWINSLLEKGIRPFIIIFERVKIEDAPRIETEYIEKYKDTIFNTFKRIHHQIANTNKKRKQNHKQRSKL